MQLLLERSRTKRSRECSWGMYVLSGILPSYFPSHVHGRLVSTKCHCSWKQNTGFISESLAWFLSFSHPQPAVVSILKLTESHEINMISRGQTKGYGWVDCFCSFFFRRCRAAFTILLSKGVTSTKLGQLVPCHIGYKTKPFDLEVK